jgi:hypothetical protein
MFEKYLDILGPKKPVKVSTASFIVLGMLLIAVFVSSSLVTQSQDTRSQAAQPNPGHIPPGCWYEQTQCRGYERILGGPTNCKPVLVCPTATPTVTPIPIASASATPIITVLPTLTACVPRPTCLDATPACKIAEPLDGWCPPAPLTCQACLRNKNSALCLNQTDKTSFCSEQISTASGTACISCAVVPVTPSPTPFKCSYIPTCPANDSSCSATPVQGMCVQSSSGISFQ